MKHSNFMRRDHLLIADMIAAAARAVKIASWGTMAEIEADPMRRESLLWNFTVLGKVKRPDFSVIKSPMALRHLEGTSLATK